MLRSYVAYDLETTGLDVEKDQIIEVGAIKVVDGRLVQEFTCIVNPHRQLNPYIVELTGITQDMVNAGYEKRPVVEEFIKFCEGFDVLGHNLMFDYKFMKAAAVSLKCPFEKNGVDTLFIAKKTLQTLKSKKLGNICEYYGYTNKSAHRAIHDAKATAYIYEEMVKQFGVDHMELFEPKELIFKAKKQEPITIKQKRYLMDLIKYHKIKFDRDLLELTKSEASKIIDSIILNNGMLPRL